VDTCVDHSFLHLYFLIRKIKAFNMLNVYCNKKNEVNHIADLHAKPSAPEER